MPEGFIYDTEPASRAVIAVAELLPEATFDYFKAVQRAFYVQQQDVTQVAVLSAILSALLQASPQSIGLDTQQFLQQFRSDKCRQITQAHFQKSRHFGVRGFPSMILQTGSRAEGISQEAASQMETSQTQTPQTQYNLLTSGYRSYAELAVEIDASLL